jgi:hypothetical protein
MNSALQLHQASMRSVMARRFAMTEIRRTKTVLPITREPKSRQRAAADYPSQRWQPCTFCGGVQSRRGVFAVGDPASAEVPAYRLDITPDRSGVILVEAATR